MIECRYALRGYISFRAQTGLLIRSGQEGTFTDSTIECDPLGRLHINGYVWASLLRRAAARLAHGVARARQWGKMDKDELQVSRLWTEATFLDRGNFDLVINPGIRVDREWGVAEDGALYQDELAIPCADIPCRFALFCVSEEEAQQMKELFADLLWVIGEGIETIGGGWAYGFGRLRPITARFAVLDLGTPAGRQALWQPECPGGQIVYDDASLQTRRPVIAEGKGWHTLMVEAGITEGQLLAIHTATPPLTEEVPLDMPDDFVFQR
ncbi:MAG: RAMP superfamily CRISPR-associated protein, partial [Syntrophales bacterium]|nr:RAMP superfamily CRISPR-associated protein [Syntrophales bacterium]